MGDLSVLFFPCYVDGLPRAAASVRFRALWPAKYWPEADVYPTMSKMLTSYDAFVFQKAYLVDFSRSLIGLLSRLRDKVLAFDLCDADWLQSEEHERRLLRVLPKFDFAVATTPPIREWLSRWLPTHVIPDRLDLAEFPQCHESEMGKPVSLIWFGYSHNLGELWKIWPQLHSILDQYNLPLTILSDALPTEWESRVWGMGRTPQFVKWTLEGANAEIAKHDIALVPQSSPYKSDNRAVTAWALGVAAAKDATELQWLLSLGDDRIRQVSAMREVMRRRRDVRVSVDEWKALLRLYYERKQNGGRV